MAAEMEGETVRALSLDGLSMLPPGGAVLLHVGRPEPLPGMDVCPIGISLPIPTRSTLKALLYRSLTVWPDSEGLVDAVLQQLGDLDPMVQPEIRRVTMPEFFDLQFRRRPAAVLERYGTTLFQDLLDAAQSYPLPSPDPYRFSQAELLRAQFAPVKFLIDNLLPAAGLAVLAGKPKIGKSWKALQLAGCIASGTTFLGRRVQQGPVLALMLEDTGRRLQERLIAQHAVSEQPVHYVLRFSKLDEGGIDALGREIELYKPALVIIDTIAAAVSGRFVENDAGPVGAVFNPLRELAQDRQILILVIMHHGKGTQGDAGMDIRGSSAFAGAADALLGLYRESNGCVLRAEGRDIERQELRVAFDAGGTFAWHLVGDAKDLARVEAEAAILEAIDARGGRADIESLVAETAKDRSTVQKHAKRMFEEGRLGREPGAGGLVYFRPAAAVESPGNGRTSPTPRTPAQADVRGVQGVRGDEAFPPAAEHGQRLSSSVGDDPSAPDGGTPETSSAPSEVDLGFPGGPNSGRDKTSATQEGCGCGTAG